MAKTLTSQGSGKTYIVQGSKHYLPQSGGADSCQQDTCTGRIDTWPAHASKSQVSTISLAARNKKEKDLPKPRFLSGLEAYAKRELYLLGCEDETPNELRLQAFREVFEYLIDDFKTYKPLLSQIKNEYERNLGHLRQKVRELEPLKSMLVTVSEKCENKIQAIREAEQLEIKKLVREKMELLDLLEEKRESEINMSAQITRLQEELGDQYRKYRNEHEMRKMLLSDINELKQQQQHSKADQSQEQQDASNEKDDPVMLKIALKCARNDMTQVLDELNRMKADYNDVVPERDLKLLQHLHDKQARELDGVKTQMAKLREEHDDLLQLHQQVIDNRDEIYTQLAELKQSATPRPDWHVCHNMLSLDEQKWVEMMEGRSSERILKLVMEEFRKSGGSGGGNFEGRGTADDVPKYLRFAGTVKNRRMSRSELSNLMKEIWAGKAQSDGQMGSKQKMTDFLFDFFNTKLNGNEELAAEFSYSLFDCCERNKEEAPVAFLWHVLNGSGNEEFYYHHMDVIKELMLTLQKSDPEQTGCVTPIDFMGALIAAYPLKDEKGCGDLQQACFDELKENKDSAMLKYMDLFTEDEEGNTGPFLNLLRDQTNAEIEKYVGDLQQQLGETNPVSMMKLRECIMLIDPSINQAQMQQHLRLAFNCHPEQLDDVEDVEQEVLLKRLPFSGIHRCGF